MAYNVNTYYLFLLVVMLVYQITPKRKRWYVLLAASVAFFLMLSKYLILWCLITAGITYGITRIIDSYQCEIKTIDRKDKESRGILQKKERHWLQLGLLGTVGILVVLKYTAFTLQTMQRVIHHLGGDTTFTVGKILVPVGISFYTLQAVSYMLDVYWKREKAEKNFLRVLLFLIFFPTVMEGPILQWGDTKDSLYAGEPITGESVVQGSLRIIWGLFKRMIVADRLNTAVTILYLPKHHFSGAMILLTAIVTTLQLYLEFAGTIDIIIGSARIFQIRIPENFRQPFHAQSAAEFWRRWHITLGRWFKNYIFYPVTTSNLVKRWNKYGRKNCGKYITTVGTSALALFPVWILNGLWHGPKWPYILYGVYYFIILLAEVALQPVGAKLRRIIRVADDNIWIQRWHMVRTWVIILTGEVLFRAESFRQFLRMCKDLFRGPFFQEKMVGQFLRLKLDTGDWFILTLGIIVVFLVEYYLEKKPDLLERVPSLPVIPRWGIYYALILSIVVFGAYGVGYQTVDLIYAGF